MLTATSGDRRWVWSNVYGAARTLLALGTLITLLFTSPDILFGPAAGVGPGPQCAGRAAIGFFCALPVDVDVLQPVAAVILVVVASGWRPRFTGLLHWWISFGINTSATALDGGDGVTAILTLLLVPITLLDGRKWHWEPAWSAPETSPAHRIAAASWLALQLQVAFIYLHSALAKLGVEEWADGTALYYVLTDGAFGAPSWAQGLVLPLLDEALVVVGLTWGTLALEAILGGAIFMPYRRKLPALRAGVLFHALIALTMGLVSFGLAMIAAVILYLRLPAHEFRFRLALPRVAGRRVAAAVPPAASDT